MTQPPDTTLAARLDALQATANLEASSPSEYALVCFDTACGQAYDNGQLITLSAHTEAVQAAVAKAVEAERATWREAVTQHSGDMAAKHTEAKAAAIRSRGVKG